MTYLELIRDAEHKLESNKITLGEYNELIEPLRRELDQEPCEDAISRQAVLDYIYNDLGLGDEENGKDVERQMELESSYGYVKSLPSVTPQEPKTGHWLYSGENKIDRWTCDNCFATVKKPTKICPNCGAKMEVEE